MAAVPLLVERVVLVAVPVTELIQEVLEQPIKVLLAALVLRLLALGALAAAVVLERLATTAQQVRLNQVMAALA